jgi:hypothetical protein
MPKRQRSVSPSALLKPQKINSIPSYAVPPKPLQIKYMFLLLLPHHQISYKTISKPFYTAPAKLRVTVAMLSPLPLHQSQYTKTTMFASPALSKDWCARLNVSLFQNDNTPYHTCSLLCAPFKSIHRSRTCWSSTLPKINTGHVSYLVLLVVVRVGYIYSVMRLDLLSYTHHYYTHLPQQHALVTY